MSTTRSRSEVALPSAVEAALAAPAAADEATVEAAGIPFHVRAWGDPAASPVLLLHGVTSSSLGWWRVAPALAAAGLRVWAPDLPGHGRTGHWRGHWRFRDNARDVVALAEALGIARVGPRVVGHSWGAMTAAALPVAGLMPRVLVLLDPPAIPRLAVSSMLDDPVEHHYDDIDVAVAAIRAANPGWPEGDIEAKAEALTQYEEPAASDVLLRNGDWDGGLAELSGAPTSGSERWLIRGDPASGGLVPDEAMTRFEALLGADRVVTLAGAPHSPHRVRPRETVAALLRALGVDRPAD